MLLQNYETDKNGGRNGKHEILATREDLMTLIDINIDYVMQKCNRAITIDCQGRMRDSDNWVNGDTITIDMLLNKAPRTRQSTSDIANHIIDLMAQGKTLEDIQKMYPKKV